MYGAPAEQKIWKTDVTFLSLTSKYITHNHYNVTHGYVSIDYKPVFWFFLSRFKYLQMMR
jgi:hypothetical protein